MGNQSLLNTIKFMLKEYLSRIKNIKIKGSNDSCSHGSEWLFIHTVVECTALYYQLLPDVTKALIVKKEEERQSFKDCGKMSRLENICLLSF